MGDPLTTCSNQTGWQFTSELYPSRQFRIIDNPDRQFCNNLIWTCTRTQSEGPEPLLTLPKPRSPETLFQAGQELDPCGLEQCHLLIDE
jgi:hypothetical protein